MNIDRIYAELCRKASRFEKLKQFHGAPEELRRNIKIAGLDINGEDVVAFTILVALIGGVLATTIALASMALGLSLIFPLIAGVLPVLLYLGAGWYPSWRAEKEQVRGMGGAPRLLGYLAAKLKINPNIERAARFAAEHTEGSLGENLREELWRACLRTHNSVEESLFEFSQRWKEWCEELSRSLRLMVSSTSERDEVGRRKVLDQALEIGLQGTRERMESFAMQLQLLTILIYGVGVLLPLVLLAVLPVLGSVNLRVSGLELALIYCVGLPLIVYVLEKLVLSKRPAAFPPPKIPTKDNTKRAAMLAIPIAVSPPMVAFYLGLTQTIVLLSLLWSVSLGISAYCYFSSVKTYGAREENLKVEREFCDALVQLGNQMKGGRPAEDAFRRAASTSKGSNISKVFEKVSQNLKFGGGGLRSALFDPMEGALRGVHSSPIRSSLRMLVDVMERSTVSAGEAVLQTAEHLKKLKQVEREIRRSLKEIVSSMRSVALFFAPLVAAVTVRLQQFLSEKTAGMPVLGGTHVSFQIFLTILGIYIVGLSILLSNYTVEIEWGDDQLIKRMTIARILPISMAVFTLGLIIGGQMLSFLAG